MSKQEWSELALVGAAAIQNGMSYGFYVAAGMPNLERFKRAVNSGEYAPRRRGTTPPSAALTSPLTKGGERAKTPKRNDRRAERKAVVCIRCEETFVAEIKAGPLPKYCPKCKELRRKEAIAAKNAKQRAKNMIKKAGELLA